MSKRTHRHCRALVAIFATAGATVACAGALATQTPPGTQVVPIWVWIAGSLLMVAGLLWRALQKSDAAAREVVRESIQELRSEIKDVSLGQQQLDRRLVAVETELKRRR